MKNNQHEQGYQDFYKGVQFSDFKCHEWQEGWHAAAYEHWLENSNQKDYYERQSK